MTPRKLNVTQTRLLIELPHGTVLAQDDFQAEQLAALKHTLPALAGMPHGVSTAPVPVGTAVGTNKGNLVAGTFSSPHWRN